MGLDLLAYMLLSIAHCLCFAIGTTVGKLSRQRAQKLGLLGDRERAEEAKGKEALSITLYSSEMLMFCVTVLELAVLSGRLFWLRCDAGFKVQYHTTQYWAPCRRAACILAQDKRV